MIPNEEKEGWHFLAVKKLSKLLRGITSKLHGVFYCLNCLHFFKAKHTLKSHEKVCKRDFYGVFMLAEGDNILEFNRYMMSDKMLYIIYVGI